MAETIYKYDLKLYDFQAIPMPEGSKILTTQLQCDEIRLWVLCDPEKHLQQRIFLVVGTGIKLPCPSEQLRYVDTVQHGAFVWHVFERIAPKPEIPKTVKLSGLMYHSPYEQMHESIKGAAISAYYAIEDNSFYPISIETPGGKVWERDSSPQDIDQLRALGEIVED